MDQFTPFQNFSFKKFIFSSTRYEEYCDGKLISSGKINVNILAKCEEDEAVYVDIIGNPIETKIQSSFEFDTTITLNDRIQFSILPVTSNIDDVTFQLLRSIIRPTRHNYNFNPLEPIVGHIFTENMTVVKMSFKMANPIRLIEFY